MTVAEFLAWEEAQQDKSLPPHPERLLAVSETGHGILLKSLEFQADQATVFEDVVFSPFGK